MKIRDYRSEGSIRVVPPGLHTMDHQVPPISLLLWCKSLIPTWNRTQWAQLAPWHAAGAAKSQWGVLREATCSAISKIWKSLLYSQPRDTPAPPHLAPSRKSSCEANVANRKLHKRCSFESKWSLSSTFKAEVKLSLQKKAVTKAGDIATSNSLALA